MASVTKEMTKGGEKRWIAKWRDPDGNSKEKWFPKNMEAEAFANQIETDKIKGTYVDPALGKTTVADYLVEWRAGRSHLAPKTLATEASLIANHIQPVFGRRTLGGLRRSDLTRWISGLVADGYSPATVHKVVITFSACLESAADDGLIPRSPAHKLNLPSVTHEEKRFLSHAEVTSLAEAIDPRYRALVFTGAYSGLRIGEMAGLRVTRLDLLRRSLRVEETVAEVRGEVVLGIPKTKKSRRTVALPRFLTRELETHLAKYGTGDDGLVFPAPAGGPLRASGFRSRIWKPAVEASVGQPCTPHDLRHSHAALLIAEGTHPKVIQERLGHASIRTTLDTYGHLFEGLDEGAADALDIAFEAGSSGASL